MTEELDRAVRRMHRTAGSVRLMGTSEIIERIRPVILPQTAYRWRMRGLLPEPGWTIGNSGVWTEEVIEAWAAARGRTLAPAGEIAPENSRTNDEPSAEAEAEVPRSASTTNRSASAGEMRWRSRSGSPT
jgi:hypothetical protein